MVANSDADPLRGESCDITAFHRVVAPLAGGELLFPRPFDVLTSAALAANTTCGDDAEAEFAEAVAEGRRRFRIRVDEIVPGSADGREIVDCEVEGVRITIAVLRSLICDLRVQERESRGAQSGSPPH